MSLLSCGKVMLTHDIDNPEPVSTYTPHKGIINACIWNHTNQFIGSCGHDGKIFLKTPKGCYTLEDSDSNTNPINSISFTSDSLLLASGGVDTLVKVWDLKSKSLHSKYKAHYGAISSVDWHSNDTILASSSIVGDIILHNISNGVTIADFKQKATTGIKMIKFSPLVKEYLGAASNDGTVSIWDINKRCESSVYTMAHSSGVNSICFSPQNQVLLCSVSLDQNINFYDIKQKKMVKTINSEGPLTSLGFNLDGLTVVVGTLYGNLMVYDLRNLGGKVKILKGHENNRVNFLDLKKAENKSGSLTESMEKENVLKKKELNSQNSSLMMSSSELKIKKENSKDLIRNVNNNKEINYSPISKSQKEIRSNYDEIKTKLNSMKGMEDLKTDSFQKNDVKSTFIERRSSEHNKQSLMNTNNLFLKKEMNISQFNNNNINKPLYDMPPKPINKDFLEVPNKTKENEFFLEKPKPKFSLDEIQKRTQDKITENGAFSENQKDFLNNLLKENQIEMKSFFQDALQDLHLEIIRQFQIQQTEITVTIEKNMAYNQEMNKRIKDLELENFNLKKITY